MIINSKFTKKLFALSGMLFFSLLVFQAQGQKTESLATCQQYSNNDIGDMIIAAGVNATTFVLVSGDCTGLVDCQDFFQVTLGVGGMIEVSYCEPGAGTNFDPSLSIWDAGGTQVACNDDTCGLDSEVTYVAAVAGTYNVELGTFSNNGGGEYTLAVRTTGAVVATPLVPTMGEWGVICLGMILIIFGVVTITQRETRLAVSLS